MTIRNLMRIYSSPLGVLTEAAAGEVETFCPALTCSKMTEQFGRRFITMFLRLPFQFRPNVDWKKVQLAERHTDVAFRGLSKIPEEKRRQILQCVSRRWL